MGKLSIPTAMAMLRTIARYTPADLDVLGIPPENFEIITSKNTWRAEHREPIVRTITAVIFGSLKIMGLPPIVVPTEHLAAVIATLIQPENHWVACVWLGQERMTGAAAIDLAANNSQPSQWEPTSGTQLYALVCLLNDADETNYARQKYMLRMGIRIDEAERMEG